MEIHIRGKGRVRIDTGTKYIESVKAMADYRESLTLVFPDTVVIENFTVHGHVSIDCEGNPPVITTTTRVGEELIREITPEVQRSQLDEIWRRFFGDKEAR